MWHPEREIKPHKSDCKLIKIILEYDQLLNPCSWRR